MNKINKILRISLLGALLFAVCPIVTYAQSQYPYYNYGNTYSYTPVSITTTNAINITSSSAILNGLVNGTNLYSTYNLETWFQYGTSTNFEYSTTHINSNSGYANYSANVANLSPNTTYYFRAVAQNPQGVIYGNTSSFRTNFAVVTNTDNNNESYPSTPSIITNPATSVGSRSAKLNSLIVSAPNNSTTWFEWGTNPTLGEMTPAISLGSLSSAKHISTITGLAPGVTYYFRAAMQNGISRINGATLSFATNNVVSASNVTEKNTDNGADTSAAQSTDSLLAANALGATSFLPVNLFSWTILVIFILILLIISKHFYRSFREKKSTHSQEHA